VTKNEKKLTGGNFWLSKIANYLSLKEAAQATGEAFSPQKRTSSTSKDENSLLLGNFRPP
jgi:hypothetical protein